MIAPLRLLCPFHLLRFVGWLPLLLALGAGCAAPTPPPSAPSAPRLPPAHPLYGPPPPSPKMELTLKREVQARLLQEAKSAYAEGQYAEVVRPLRRLVEGEPGPAMLAEARWWLAQTYEHIGRLQAAADEYRALVQMEASGRIDRAAAERRIQELEQALGGPTPDLRGAVVVCLPVHRLDDAVQMESRQMDASMEALRDAGVTALVLDAGTRPACLCGARRQAAPRAGVYFQTARAPAVADLFGRLVPSAHRHGLVVIAAVTLRRMNWVDPPLGWSDQHDKAAPQVLQPSPTTLDLFNPSVQDYLAGLLTDLAATGVDGLLFRADTPIGPAEGFSPFERQAYERAFGMPLDPGRLFADQAGHAPPPDFWRWAGWKARETLAVMERVMRAVRARSPRLLVGLEVHPEAAMAPSDALRRYGEDLLEATRSGFDFYVVGTAAPALAERAAELVGKAGRVWVTRPVRDLARPASRLEVASDRAGLPVGVGLFYTAESRGPQEGGAP